METKIYDRLDISASKNTFGPKHPEGIDNGTKKFSHHNKGAILNMAGFSINYSKAGEEKQEMKTTGTLIGSQNFVQAMAPKEKFDM